MQSGGDRERGRRARDDRGDLEQLMDVGMRFEGGKALVNGLRRSGLSGSIGVGSVVVARQDVPSSGIVESQAYEVVAIYYQGMRGAEVERVPVEALDAPPPDGCAGYTKYVSLFSEDYHEAPVVVRPEQAGLVTLRDEVADALSIGAPILAFWLVVCAAFLAYGSATG